MELIKCLVADDDEMGRELIAQQLNGIADCTMAEDGADALQKFREAMDAGEPYELLILDVLMPGMTGHEAGKAIRAIEREKGLPLAKQVKIVILTSLSSPQDVMASFMSAQSAAHLVKPVEPAKLRETLGKLGLKRR